MKYHYHQHLMELRPEPLCVPAVRPASQDARGTAAEFNSLIIQSKRDDLVTLGLALDVRARGDGDIDGEVWLRLKLLSAK